jgi:hypothetical protein
MRSVLLAIAALAAGLAPHASCAEQAGSGIAMVFAIEEAFESCRGNDPARAMNCAMKKCETKAASPDTCKPARWCGASGWSAFMMVRQEADFAFPVPICGAPSKKALQATMRAYCAEQLEGSRCDAVTMRGPDGQEEASHFLATASKPQ